jgi:uncharacterized protein (TIGR03435 family)
VRFRNLAAVIVLTFTTIYGQEFEVASIRLSPPQNSQRIRVRMDGGPGTNDPTRFSCRCSLSMLVMEAYNVKYYQIAGLGSRESEIYDTAANVPPAATREQFHIMLQKLLAERFHLVLHRSVRKMRAYDLIVAKNGPKIKRSVADEASADNTEPPLPDRSKISLDEEGFPILPLGRLGMLYMAGKVHMQGVGDTMDQVAAKLENQLDLPVVNSTQLLGKYDFSLYWAVESAGADNSGPSLFSAVESQLGLKLSPKNASVPLIVIDHIDAAPSGN